MPSFKCKDMGLRCKFKVKSDNRDEVIQIVALHSEKSHSMKRIPSPMMDKVKQVIKK